MRAVAREWRRAVTVLIAGLIVFLGVHSLRIFADDWRGRQIARLGPGAFKGLYSLVSLLGLVLIVVGYGQAREAPVVLWDPPLWTRHLTALLTLFAFVLVVAAYVPRNRIKAAVGHPMILGVKIWAAGHLLSNGSAADLLLFGGILLWAAIDHRAARRRDRVQPPVPVRPTLTGTVATIVVGAGLWAAFALHLHVRLFGVRPFVTCESTGGSNLRAGSTAERCS
jgi:uncharacterized membrane protein